MVRGFWRSNTAAPDTIILIEKLLIGWHFVDDV